MSKKSNPTVIGSFVLGAIVLFAIAVVLFGGADLLARKTRFETYFDGSVMGLRVGSNVLFRGVRIGFVQDIDLMVEIDTLEPRTRVILEILPDSFVVTRGGVPVGVSSHALVTPQELIDAGLRAQLGTESFVTGQLVVELDFLPDTPVVMRGKNLTYPEIPTVPSDVQEALGALREMMAQIRENLDIGQLVTDLQQAVSGANELMNSPDIRESLAGINRFVNSEDTQQIATQITGTLGELQAAIDDMRTLIRNVDGQLQPMGRDLRQAIAQLDDTLGAAEDTLRSATAQLQGESELSYELAATLSELKDAARTLRVFLDYLERNPEALLRGKKP